MGYGIKGFLGIAKESVWGTPVAAADYSELMSEGISQDIDRFEVANITGGLYEPDDMAGVIRIAGDMALAGNPLILGHLLKAAFNVNSQTVVASGSLWGHRFSTPQADFATGVAGVPYTLELNRDQSSSHQYAGMCLDKLVMSYAPNQDLRLNSSWIGKALSLITATVPTLPSSPADPFAFDTSSISLAGAASARLEALTITIDNQLEGVPTLNNSTQIARIDRKGPQMVRLAGTLDFPDVTEHLDFINQTVRAFKVSLTRAASFQCIVDIPQFVYTAFPTGQGGRGRNRVQFQGRAKYLPASNAAASVILTTTKSNY